LRTFIHLASSSLGDTLGWIPQAEEYRITNKSEVDIRITPRLVDLFVSVYPFLNFVTEAKGNYEASFSIACHEPNDFTIPLIQLATERLDLPLQEIKPKIALPPNLKNNFKKKYVCIATQSTAQCKYWNNPTGWDQTVDYLQSLGYEVVCIDQHVRFGVEGHWNDTPVNSIRKNQFDGDPEIPLTDRINDLYFCDFFIGLGSGLSWLAWALNKPVVLISGFSAPKAEFYTPYRVINEHVCNSCWNDVECMPFDSGDWMWCPRHKGTPREFECSKEITFEMVKKQIDRLL
jgi:autotransporter strand-loop-strand O-heptosyltransferase